MALQSLVLPLVPLQWASQACFLGALMAVFGARWALHRAVARPRSRWLSLALAPCYLLLWAAYWLPPMQPAWNVLATMRRCPRLGGLPAALLQWRTLRRLVFLVLGFEHCMFRHQLELLPLRGASPAACRRFRRAMLHRAAEFGLWPLLACRNVVHASLAVCQARSQLASAAFPGIALPKRAMHSRAAC